MRGLSIVVVIVFALLAINLWRIQIDQGSYYRTLAKGNSLQLVSIPATRGDIIDKNGKVLASSFPQFELTLDPMVLQKLSKTEEQDHIKRLAEYIQPYWTPNEPVDKVTEDILVMIQAQTIDSYRPVVLLHNISNELQATIVEHQNELPGIQAEAIAERTYPLQALAGQTLGYVREIGQNEIADFNNNPDAQKAGFEYKQGDTVGKMGIEKSYDFWLRGQDGTQQVEVNSSGQPQSKEVLQQPVAGKTVQLTINADLQTVVENKLDEVIKEVQQSHPQAQSGSAVVIDVNTGKILAMVSKPAMNPNDLIGPISNEIADKYFKSAAAASLNRTISGVYPPGSTFKMITAMAGLVSKVTTPEESISDTMDSLGPGPIRAQGFPEWGGHNFGMVNMYRSLALSSDIYFEIIGRRVFESSPELIKQISNEFGLGVKSGIDIPGEAKGTAPSIDWKKANFQPYYQKQYEKKITDIDAKYSAQINQTTDVKAKQKLQTAQDNEKKQAQSEYDAAIKDYVDWHVYDSFNNSIGQGYNSYTPLQLANYVATMVNGGIHYKPYLVDKVIDPVTKNTVEQTAPTVLNKVSVSPDVLETVKKGMSVVTSGEGTAAFLFTDLPQFTGGGKTGTAQLGSKDTAEGSMYNGVFVAFAPYDHPQIAFAGVVDYGNHGSETAGYVAKAAFEQYFGWKSTDGK